MDTLRGTDPRSVGFSAEESSTLLLKKYQGKASTKFETPTSKEPPSQQIVYNDRIASQSIPSVPPTDFVPLSNSQIIAEFGMTEAEIRAYYTYVHGVNVFSIERSISRPYILKVNNCLMKPWAMNPELTFSGITAQTKVNLLEHTIVFKQDDNLYQGTFYRTTPTGALSRDGNDIIKDTQLAWIYDNDVGFFTCYEKDTTRYTTNPLSSTRPPAITCYIYRGAFGIYGDNLWQKKGSLVYWPSGQCLVNGSVLSDPSLTLEVNGTALIDDIITSSLETLSDIRVKENIKDYKPDKAILELGVYTYNIKSKPDTRDLGLIAQEVECIVPEIVRNHRGLKSLQYDKIGALLLPIVKEQEERIRFLEASIAELKAAFEAPRP